VLAIIERGDWGRLTIIPDGDGDDGLAAGILLGLVERGQAAAVVQGLMARIEGEGGAREEGDESGFHGW
jgi:hypothetical protein